MGNAHACVFRKDQMFKKKYLIRLSQRDETQLESLLQKLTKWETLKNASLVLFAKWETHAEGSPGGFSFCSPNGKHTWHAVLHALAE